jgi:hypothetical protein
MEQSSRDEPHNYPLILYYEAPSGITGNAAAGTRKIRLDGNRKNAGFKAGSRSPGAVRE